MNFSRPKNDSPFNPVFYKEVKPSANFSIKPFLKKGGVKPWKNETKFLK